MMKSNSWLFVASVIALAACAQGETSLDPVDNGGGGSAGRAVIEGGGSAGEPTGTGGDPNVAGAGGSTQCELVSWNDATCGSCMADNCQAACTACEQNPSCLDLLSCILDQTCDAACEEACFTQHSAGENDLLGYLGNSGCIGTACATPCDVSFCTFSSSNAACEDCFVAKCEAQCAACSQEPQCGDLLDCLNNCTTVACEDGCFSSYPAGEQPLLEFIGTSGCVSTNCSAECS